MNIDSIKFIPWLPAIAAALCGICCTSKGLRKLAAPICIASIALGFAIAWLVSGQVHTGESATPHIVHFFDWINIGDFHADFSYFIDPLTVIMLFVVTGIGTLVAIYASGYMSGDRGYARFFAAVCLFIFAMTNLVMADNLVLLYLGWEGVGLCSYLLIGFYYNKPSAVAAAKKAFIVNRIGDLGFALGIFLIYRTFHTVTFWAQDGSGFIQQAHHAAIWAGNPAVLWIPFLLMLGAFGKSAQLPLYVWLPDAMEGPTPVSALIHAATMVTAGVYMISRLMPLFVLSPAALPTVAVVGCVTALFAATIALCQYDIKRIYAYSTISQLGYMFLGVGVMSTVGGVFHLFTHAFFKALLFLTAGSVMHALSGQLDLRKMSGLAKKMPWTCWLMFVGCLALAGFPGTAGFFSKDEILGDAMVRGLGPAPDAKLYLLLAILGLFTAFLTAFYTFRLWFRVFMGPEQYEMGNEAHGHEEDHGHADSHGSGITVEHDHEPHEVGWLLNGPLVILALGALFAGWFCSGWIASMVGSSTAASEVIGSPDAQKIHHGMMWISGGIALSGILLAWYYHLYDRAAADRVAERNKDLVRLLANKYYVDELYDALIVKPLRLMGEVFFIIDRMIIDGLVNLVGFVPRALGLSLQPAQRGALQGYGLGMAIGAGAVFLVIVTHLY